MQEETPSGLYMAPVKIGPKGQIVIPKEAREMFGLRPGDRLMLLADENRGIALHRYDVFRRMLEEAGVPQRAFAAAEEQAVNSEEPACNPEDERE